MFGLFKKKISDEELADFLLCVWANNADELQKVYIKQFDYDGDLIWLGFEIKIFSLWIILKSLPNADDTFRELLLKILCEDMTPKFKQLFLSSCMTRYPKYDYAFDLWAKNPQSFRLWEALCVILERRDLHWDPAKCVHVIEPVCIFNYSIFFKVAFESTLTTINNLRKKFKSSTLNN